MATFTVTTAADVVNANDGLVSLREAVAQANATAAADTILFASGLEGRTLTLTGGELVLRQDVTIDGDQNGDGIAVTLSGGDTQRILRTSGGETDVALEDLTLTHGQVTGAGKGGALFVGGGGVAIHGSVVESSRSGAGGGVYALSGTRLDLVDSTIRDNLAAYGAGGGVGTGENVTVLVRSSEISGNESNVYGSDAGGGIQIGRGGSLSLEDSIVRGNAAGGGGGGLDLSGATATILRSTIAGGLATFGDGGGIRSTDSLLQIDNSTIVGNSAGYEYGEGTGGGIAANGGILLISNSTITGNGINDVLPPEAGIYSTGGGIAVSGTALTLSNSIVLGNTADADPDLAGAITTSNGHNIFGSDVAGTVAGDLENVAPSALFAALDPDSGGGALGDHGGPTPTVALRLALDNPALEGADPATAGLTDQRGVARPQPLGTAPDIGAFESAPLVPPKAFDGLEYVASYPDLIAALGPSAAAGTAHYLSYGIAEGRTVSFDGLDYVASYADLGAAFGANRDAGAAHFIGSGYGEGRAVTFAGLEYVASYADLGAAFGVDPAAGAAHFITYGRAEGRSTSFDGLAYVASYDDLSQALGADAANGAAHFIAAGRAEGRATSFDGLQYIATYGDLIGAFGPDRDAGAVHFIDRGRAEARVRDGFDEVQYLANYPDLQAAFGGDTAAATVHFIAYGFAEGRTDQALAAAADFLM